MEYLGIDVGSSYLKVWIEDEYQDPVASRCMHHKGSPKACILEELSHLGRVPEYLCYCGNLSGQAMKQWHYDGIIAEIDFLKGIYPQRYLLIFGAEKIELVHYDSTGRILSYQTNPTCAAGTGSFLDEQMKRLGLSLEGLDHIPIDEDAPLVASRCAVFAKTDLIHLQQEGHSAYAMYNGLCKGLVISGIRSMFGGSIPDGSDILLSGGLLINPHVRHFLSKMLPHSTTVSNPMFSRAKGLCEKARQNAFKTNGFVRSLKASGGSTSSGEEFMPLDLDRSTFPSVEISRKRDAFDNELWHDIRPGEFIDAYLGVDIGSTSTKAVLVDTADAIRLDLYTKTAGNPLEATRRIFSGIVSLQEALGFACTIRGCSTTGSGRTLVGKVIGADCIINEISAHAKGAKTVDPGVKTIFEIGGQDAKFIRLDKGRIVDVNMNYVCAAGTGSFIEEQANTLGIGLDEISSMVMGVKPLPNSDRCTVFMNQEITTQLAAGYPKERIMAGVLLAVCKNFINRVVGNRPYDRETIVFQGATARNRGLVAALENIAGARIMVSPFCHVMGAYGAALLAKERGVRDTAFRGFSIGEVQIRESSCRRCENTCRITTIKTGTETVSWGHMCGIEPGTNKRTGRKNPAMKIRQDLLQGCMDKGPVTGQTFKIPALNLYEELLPLFKEIARACTIPIDVCYFSKKEITQELSSIGTGDFCYPIKVAMACANLVLKKYPDDNILLPYLIQDERDESIHPRSLYCPFITGLPGFYRQGPHAHRIFTPTIDLSRDVSWQARQLKASLASAGTQRIRTSTLARALSKGMEELRRYRRNLVSAGRTLLERIAEGSRIIVLFGRSYNLYHKVLNLGIPELVESLGYTVIPMDIIPDTASNADVVERFPDLYWYQGQKILRKALSVADRPNMFPLLISNFSCGPDSFLLSYFEDICRDKPYLILELDEHGSATGYQTRIEAFCDMIEQHAHDTTPKKRRRLTSRIRYRLDDIQGDARIWIPQIHPYIPQLWASVLQHHGHHAIAMGEETQAQCSAGRAYCRGSECLPAAVTIGKFLSCMHAAEPDSGNVLFMPRAEGPCRFGQYATLQSGILERAGINNAHIFSPTSENGYAFLDRKTEREVWKATCLGDMLYKLRCRTMPYHPQPGMCETLFKRTLRELSTRMLMGEDVGDTIRLLVHELCSAVDFSQPRKPLVGIVGEIFVRLNSFSNQHVVEAIESCGAEAWLSPFAEWVHYVLALVSRKGSLRTRLGSYIKRRYIQRVEEDTLRLFSPILDDLHEPHVAEVIETAQRFLPVDFEGESILTLGRAKRFASQGAAVVVNCSPFGCMPGRITSYIFQNNPEYFEVPVVNLFFDGIGDIASQVTLYLNSITLDRSRSQHQSSSSFRLRSHPGHNHGKREPGTTETGQPSSFT